MNRFAPCSVLLALVLAVFPSTHAIAADAPPPGWTPVEPARLDTLRGGFVVPQGFVVSFGIERVVSVNGEVVAATSVRIPDIARLSVEQANALAGLRDSQVVTVGAGTLVAGGASGLVIQNAVDGQSISARTSLDVSLNTLQLYRDSRFGGAITDAVIRSIPSP